MPSRPNRCFILLALSLTCVCGQAASAAELLVSAAISLKDPLIEIGHHFEEKHPGNKVVFNFGASGSLATQIIQGAPVDVFASAAKDQIEKLREKNMLDGSVAKNFARNNLVVIVPDNAVSVKSLAELSDVKKLAIGNPETVPAGRYAVEVLKGARVYDRLSAKHALVFCENVRQVLTYVEKSEVDAGMVYGTEAKSSKSVHTAIELPTNTSEPIVYPIAAIKDSKQLKLGRAFVDFLLDKDQQNVFRKFGFLAP